MLESHLGIQLPASVADVLQTGAAVCGLYPFDMDQLLSYRLWGPSTPFRVVPILDVGDGPFVGIYFPRSVAEPVVVSFETALDGLQVLHMNAEQFFSQAISSVGSIEFARLGTECRAEYLRSPLSILSLDEDMAGSDRLLRPMWLDLQKIRLLGPAYFESAFASKGSPGTPGALAKTVLETTHGVYSPSRWLSCAKRCQDLGFTAEALLCLDNAHASCFLCPRGQVLRPDWELVHTVMLAYASSPSLDQFDRFLAVGGCQSAREI